MRITIRTPPWGTSAPDEADQAWKQANALLAATRHYGTYAHLSELTLIHVDDGPTECVFTFESEPTP